MERKMIGSRLLVIGEEVEKHNNQYESSTKIVFIFFIDISNINHDYY
jgi:uncharacterized protein (DUF1330 family)